MQALQLPAGWEVLHMLAPCPMQRQQCRALDQRICQTTVARAPLLQALGITGL